MDTGAAIVPVDFLGRAPAPPDPPSFVNLSITMRCNLRCHMCDCPNIKVSEPTPDRWLAFIDRLGDWLPTGTQVLVTGGEPMLHHRCVDFVERLASFGLKVALNTNGTLLNVDKVERLKDAGLSILNVSVDGLAATHDRLRNGPGSFQGIVDILHYVGKHTDWTLHVVPVINAQNHREMPEVVRFFTADPRIKAMHFQSVIPTMGKPWDDGFFDRDALWPKSSDEAEAIAATLETLKEMKRDGAHIDNPEAQFSVWQRYFRNPRNGLTGNECRVAYGSLIAQSNGDLTFCDVFGPVGTIDDDVRAMWESTFAQNRRDDMSRCNLPCNYRVNCCFDESTDPAPADAT
ncbi:radical SAM protein [bacterium]|nr:radical SAM protein [bacterium]